LRIYFFNAEFSDEHDVQHLNGKLAGPEFSAQLREQWRCKKGLSMKKEFLLLVVRVLNALK